MYRCTVGSSIVVKEMFVDPSTNTALLPDTSEIPLVALFSQDKDVIYKAQALPGHVPGEWIATLNVPVLPLKTPVELYILWRFKDDVGNYHHVRDAVLVSPSETRDSEWVILESDSGFTASFPFGIDPTTFTLSLYRDNEPLFVWSDDTDPAYAYDIKHNSDYGCSLYFPTSHLHLQAALPPLVAVASGISANDISERSASWLFVINPSILSASIALEEYINKARIKNVIPELDYRTTDLLLYLERGLSLFNSYPPQITGFNGRAMAGALLDCWLLCSSYYILTAQIQAEGASSFDFSGQSVSLNVDRTQAIEGAISRLESMLDTTVKPFKKTLIKSGVTGGDGNIKGALSFGRSFGRLILTNNPLSRAQSSYGIGSRIIPQFPFRRGVFF